MKLWMPLLLLAGCASINPITIARLATLDPLTVDPAGFEVALDLPDGIGLDADGARLILEGARGEALSRGVYVLQERPGDPQIWRIAPGQLDALRAQQAQLAEWEEADPEETSGSMGIDLGTCRIGAGPGPEAVVNVSLRVELGGPLLSLVRNGQLSDVVDGATVAQLPACVDQN